MADGEKEADQELIHAFDGWVVFDVAPRSCRDLPKGILRTPSPSSPDSSATSRSSSRSERRVSFSEESNQIRYFVSTKALDETKLPSKVDSSLRPGVRLSIETALCAVQPSSPIPPLTAVAGGGHSGQGDLCDGVFALEL